jgi:hypothetical protein
MLETLYVENMNGHKSYYELDVISKSEDKKIVIIKHWNGGQKTLKLDEKRNIYISAD